MKKGLFTVLALVLVMLAACSNSNEYEGYPQESEPADTSQAKPPETTQQLEEFSFRGHKFWDSLEQVIEKEGEPDRDKIYDEDNYAIFYDDVYIFGYKVELSFTFLYEELYMIDVNKKEFNDGLTKEQRYLVIKQYLKELYGEPYDDMNEELAENAIMGLWGDVELHYVMSLYSSDERLSFGMRGVPNFSAD